MTAAVTVAQSGAPGVSLGFKNRIINGDMRIDQRNAGASVTVNSASATFTVDRFYGQANGGGAFTLQRSTDAPAGFVNSLVATVTTVDSSIAATDFYDVAQMIEGYNVADMSWGSANAKTITISFWVKSSLTGTMGGAFCNGGLSRSYPFTFTINASNTWEQKSVTIAGDTTGTWPTDNSAGAALYFSLGAGSTRTASANAWGSGWTPNASGQTNVIGTNGATFYITGVQLEKGTAATQFEYRDYGRELMMCQRYYYRINSIAANQLLSSSGYSESTTTGWGIGAFPVAMRTSPSALETSGTPGDYNLWEPGVKGNNLTSGPTFFKANLGNWALYGGVAAANANRFHTIIANNTSAFLAWSAEL